jgi:hypothetical protein
MIASVRRTDTGIACARCSHWENRKRIVVHHATVADVRACSMQPHTPPRNFDAAAITTARIDFNAAWAAAKNDFAAHEAAQERAAYEAKMARDEELEQSQLDRTVTSWPSAREAVEAGRYALEVDGVTKFYKVDKPTEGRWAGYTFVNVQASDELYPVRNKIARDEILNLIAANPKEAMLRYGKELGHCGHCGRTLTDETSRSLGIGPVCRGKLGW